MCTPVSFLRHEMIGFYDFRWNNHPVNLVSGFSGLFSNERLTDVTLAAEGRHLKAHKMLLSACSDYFQVHTSKPCPLGVHIRNFYLKVMTIGVFLSTCSCGPTRRSFLWHNFCTILVENILGIFGYYRGLVMLNKVNLLITLDFFCESDHILQFELNKPP